MFLLFFVSHFYNLTITCGAEEMELSFWPAFLSDFPMNKVFQLNIMSMKSIDGWIVTNKQVNGR